MYNYDGIGGDVFMLLGENKFQNSKEFYDAHKEDIKHLVIKPMQRIAEIIGEDLAKLDDKMNVNPTKMISRIRRDTRFTKDKSLYRQNVWITFMRPKSEFATYPCMWFEIQPGCYSYGVGGYENSPQFMEIFRKSILLNSNEFLKAVKSAESVGAELSTESYKRDKSINVPENLKKYYNSKNFYMIKYTNSIKNLEDDKIIEELKTAYKAYSLLYTFLKNVADEYVAYRLADD